MQKILQAPPLPKARRTAHNTEMIVCRPGGIVVVIENGDSSELDAVGQ